MKRKVDLKRMPLWRKLDIVIGLIRRLVVCPQRLKFDLSIVQPKASFRVNNGTLNLGRFSEFHRGSILWVMGMDEHATFTMGRRSSIGFNSVVSVKHKVTIGDECAISWNCTIIDNDMHQIHELPENVKASTKKNEVVIGNHVWVGAGVMILKGVTIGDNCVIAAGSIVTRDIPPNTLAAGVPAKPVREIEGWS